MSIHPLARWLLIVAALAVALAAPRSSLGFCAGVVAMTYLLLGRARMLATYALLVAPFLLVAALLWLYVYLDFSQLDLTAGGRRLVGSDSSFLILIRTMLGTAAIVLALRALPDGETYPVLRRMGFPKQIAFVFTSGIALVDTVRDAFERSVVALKAQGILRETFGSRFANLGRALGLTWLAGLTAAATRAEVKWDGNGFVDQLESGRSVVSVGLWSTFVAIIASVGLIVLALIPLRIIADVVASV